MFFFREYLSHIFDTFDTRLQRNRNVSSIANELVS